MWYLTGYILMGIAAVLFGDAGIYGMAAFAVVLLIMSNRIERWLDQIISRNRDVQIRLHLSRLQPHHRLREEQDR